MKKINVCLIKYDMTDKGGGERVAADLAKALTQYFNVHLISINGKEEEPYFTIGSEVHYDALFLGHERIRKTAWKGGRLLRKYAKENNIDVMMSIGGSVSFFMWMAARGTSIKTVFCEHTNLIKCNEDKVNALLRKLVVKTADKIITLTKRDREEYLTRYSINKDKIDYIYNWINDNIETTKCYDENSKKIITVGRFDEGKGYDMLVLSAIEVFKKHPDWRWDIYGDGPDFEKIQTLVKENHLENNLYLMGTSNRLAELYSEYAFYVMTSRTEGLPLVLLEAKSSLLPLISFDCVTGPSEIITDGKDGFLVETENVTVLTSRVLELVENSALRKEFSQHSKDNIALFRKETIVQKWVDLICELADK